MNDAFFVIRFYTSSALVNLRVGDPGAVSKAACLESRRWRVTNPALAYKFQRNKNVSLPAHSYIFIIASFVIVSLGILWIKLKLSAPNFQIKYRIFHKCKARN